MIVSAAVLMGLVSTSRAEVVDVCVVGYVMDVYCINRGTLLDAPSYATLEHPEQHSVHCLVDVPMCYNSGFEILTEPESGTIFSRAYRLDSTGRDMALTAARGSTSGCSTCNGPDSGATKGYRATVMGTTDTSNTANPPVLTVTSVQPASVGCESVNADDAEDPPASDVGAESSSSASQPSENTNDGEDSGTDGSMSGEDDAGGTGGGDDDGESTSSDSTGAGSEGSDDSDASYGYPDADGNVCIEGYLMDVFCIERGTLLDNPDFRTLEHPEEHSVHCLVDVDFCYESGFEVLRDPGDGETQYGRAYRLDDAGLTTALEFARANAATLNCQTCTGPADGPRKGFRATVWGTVDPDDTASPPLLTATGFDVAGAGCDGGDGGSPSGASTAGFAALTIVAIIAAMFALH